MPNQVIGLRGQRCCLVAATATTTVLDRGVDDMRAALLQLEVAAQLGQQVLAKADQYGADAALRGVREIMDALITNLRSAA